MMTKHILGAAAILSMGIVVAAAVLALAVKWAKDAERYVTVKGFSERPVVADQGSWNLRYMSSGMNLDEAIRQNKHDRETVFNFISGYGFSSDEIRPGTPNVNEQSGSSGRHERVSVNDSILVISSKVDKISEMARNSSKLLNSGVALSGWENPSYYFTQLGTIKPAMIEEATKDAHKGADKFAFDAGSKVGAIKRASQGFFSFNGESSGIPEGEQIKKIARVVISVDYLIAD